MGYASSPPGFTQIPYGGRPLTEKPVKIYSLRTCSHCKSTKKLLSESTIKHEFIAVDMLECCEC